jgi:nitrite reductase/ring-hydroxylating ferredoxin subunit
VDLPLEEGRLVVDLSLHPVVPGSGLLLVAAGLPGAVLLARVTLDHLAAVDGDCPHCGGPLVFDGPCDAAVCPSGAAAFRLDGTPTGGTPAALRLRSFPVRRLGMRVEIEAAAGAAPPG